MHVKNFAAVSDCISGLLIKTAEFVAFKSRNIDSYRLELKPSSSVWMNGE